MEPFRFNQIKSSGLVVFLTLFSGLLFTVSAQVKSLLYQGSWNGEACAVTINWSNHGGLSAVTGQIFIQSSGKSFQFTGQTTSPGRLEMTVPGDPVYRFDRQVANGKTTWALVPGGNVLFSRSNNAGGGSGLPGSGSGLPGGGGGIKPDLRTTTATGSWGVNPISITINWDNYAGQGPVSGKILFKGTNYSFTGTNPSKGYMEIIIDNVTGTYPLNKSGKGASAIWSGSLNGTPLSFGPSSVVGGGGNSNPNPLPGVSLWVIACEAARDRPSAEKRVAVWKARGYSGACVIHKTQYNSMTGDKNWWIACPGTGSKGAMQALLPGVKAHFPSSYGIKADQSFKRETFE
jgi:hypothetical protein